MMTFAKLEALKHSVKPDSSFCPDYWLKGLRECLDEIERLNKERSDWMLENNGIHHAIKENECLRMANKDLQDWFDDANEERKALRAALESVDGKFVLLEDGMSKHDDRYYKPYLDRSCIKGKWEDNLAVYPINSAIHPVIRRLDFSEVLGTCITPDSDKPACVKESLEHLGRVDERSKSTQVERRPQEESDTDHSESVEWTSQNPAPIKCEKCGKYLLDEVQGIYKKDKPERKRIEPLISKNYPDSYDLEEKINQCIFAINEINERGGV